MIAAFEKIRSQARQAGRRVFQSAMRRVPAHDSLVDAPLLSSEGIAELAVQAAGLARAPARREVHDHHAGDWPSAWLGRGLDFEEARPYNPGDDIRDMDWRTTARLGQPFIKTYREERQPVLHVVVDRGPSMRFGTRRHLKAAQAARIAALIAFAASERNVAVGATLWDVHDLDLPPRHGRSGIVELVQAAAAPCPPLPAEAAEAMHEADRLHRLAEELPRGAKLLLISDFAWLGAVHEMPLAHLAELTDLLAVRISDPAEREMPNVGLARFQDMNTGEIRWLDTSSAAARNVHAAAFEKRRAEVDAILGRAGVHRLDMGSEADDLVQALQGHA
ncbi:MAG: DUF58 domain-containing protein [Pseudomonadota bacterium]